MTTRRQFLKQGAIGGTAAAVLAPVATALLPMPETAETQLHSWLRSFRCSSTATCTTSVSTLPTYRVCLNGPEEIQRAFIRLHDFFDRAMVRSGNVLELYTRGDCVVVRLGSGSCAVT